MSAGSGALSGAAAGASLGPIGAAAGAVIGGAIGFFSARRKKKKQREARKKLAAERARLEEERGDFEIPDEIRKNQRNAQNEAFGKPAIMRLMEENAAREEAANVGAVQRYATSGADALAAISGVNQQAAASRNDAAIAGAEARQSNMQNLYRANETMADYKNMAWDINVNMPYLQRLQWAQDDAALQYDEAQQKYNTDMNTLSQAGQMAGMYGSYMSQTGQSIQMPSWMKGGGNDGAFPSWGSSTVRGFGDSNEWNNIPTTTQSWRAKNAQARNDINGMIA